MSLRASICIVSHNRKAELKHTLDQIFERIDSSTEVIVGLDGCTDDSADLISHYPNVIWVEFPICKGASAARRIIYEQSKGDVIFGFDDDSHPVTADFVKMTIQVFQSDTKLGIIAFRIYNAMEILGPEELNIDIGNSYACSEFAGCGFAITRKAYEASGGFPIWMKIYGEEAYVSLKVFEKGFRLIYEPTILIHHRIDKAIRKNDEYQKFRFQNQLMNNLVVVLRMYPFPFNIRSAIKCTLHNLLKYGFLSCAWHLLFWKSLLRAMKKALVVSERTISQSVLINWMKLPLPVFDWNPSKLSDE